MERVAARTNAAGDRRDLSRGDPRRRRPGVSPRPISRSPRRRSTSRSRDLPDTLLEAIDVLFWWGHLAHEEVRDSLVDRVQRRVPRRHGAGGHALGPSLQGSSPPHGHELQSDLARVRGRRARARVDHSAEPPHRRGHRRPYRDPAFGDVWASPSTSPNRTRLIFLSWFQGGEVFRSGCCYYRGRGRVFYFSPGHESFPIYHHPQVHRVLANAARWATPGHDSGARFENRERPMPLEAALISAPRPASVSRWPRRSPTPRGGSSPFLKPATR